MLVKEVMTPAPFCCRVNDSIDTVAKLMVEHDCGGVRRLPVLNDDGVIVGVVSPSSDLAPTLATNNVADFLLAVSYWSRRAVGPAA